MEALPGAAPLDAVPNAEQVIQSSALRSEGRVMVAQPRQATDASASDGGEIVLIDPALAAGSTGEQEPTPVAPMVNIVSTLNFDFTPTPEPQPTLAVSPTPTPVPVALAPGRLWSNFAPVGAIDHFWVGRPFPTRSTSNWLAPTINLDPQQATAIASTTESTFRIPRAHPFRPQQWAKSSMPGRMIPNCWGHTTAFTATPWSFAWIRSCLLPAAR